MKPNLLKATFLTFLFFMLCLTLHGQSLATAEKKTAEAIFQDALQAKKNGNLDAAITLYENAVKSSPTVLANDDDGLVEAVKEAREKQFNLAPGSSLAFDNLDFVYGVCLGDQQGMLPFLKAAYVATTDEQRKSDYKARIDEIEKAQAEEAAAIARIEEEKAKMAAAEEEARAKKDEPSSAIKEVDSEKQKEVSKEDRQAAAEKTAAAAAAKKEAEEEAKTEKLNEELALNKGKMRRLDVRIQELAETIENQESNLSMYMAELENAQQEFSITVNAVNRKKLDSAKSQLSKAKKDLETNKKSLENLRELRSAYHARIIRAKKGLGIISDED